MQIKTVATTHRLVRIIIIIIIVTRSV